MARLVGINHVAVEVGDVDEALDFLGRIFELTLRGRSGHMAFVDMGDQFVALAQAETAAAPGGHRHVGLVVDDRAATLAAAEAAGARLVGGHDFLDPWGNRWQVVEYADVQFTKTPRILDGMGLGGLAKREGALAELRAKNLAD
jgi:catechol 2,3-dioxygenase-like lactoylglutathione lyase family enzyme